MLFGGVQKLTLIDFPDKVAATLFTVGCNFQCRFCYNPSLVNPQKYKTKSHFSDSVALEILKQRKSFIEGVCITGGEPTLHSDLPKFIKKVKKMGLLVKLDTNGSNPTMLKELVENKLLDYVAMDIKAPLEKYNEVVGVKIDIRKIKSSISYLMKGKVDYEFRTTVMPKLLCKKDILQISNDIFGAKRYFIQGFKNTGDFVSKDFKSKRYTKKELEEIKKKIKKNVEYCFIR